MPCPRFRHIGQRAMRDSRRARERRAHFDPGFQARDFFWRKLFIFGRHLQIRISVTHGLDQETRVRIGGDDDRSRTSALHQRLGRVEPQTTFQFLGFLTMARVTMLREQRPDFVFEEFNLLRGGLRGR